MHRSLGRMRFLLMRRSDSEGDFPREAIKFFFSLLAFIGVHLDAP